MPTSEFTVRPSTKLLNTAYLLSALLAVAVLIAWRGQDSRMLSLLALPVLLALWTALRHLGRVFTRLTLAGERLRYEAGVLSKTTRTMELRKVQDVRVDQSLGQRMLNIGNLSIETAGETSRLTILNIDRPQEVADRILGAAHQQSKGQTA